MSNGPGTGTSMQVDLPLPVRDATGKQYVFVDPRTPIHLGGPNGPPPVKEVKLTNNTGGRARLWFPNGGQVFDAAHSGVPSANPPQLGVDFSQSIEIPQAGLLSLKVDPNAPPGTYHYHVYCDVIQDCAMGNSEPQIDVP